MTQLKESQFMETEPSIQKEIVKSNEKYSDMLEIYEKQQTTSFDSDVEIELENLKLTVENIKSNLEEIQVIKKYWADKLNVAI